LVNRRSTKESSKSKDQTEIYLDERKKEKIPEYLTLDVAIWPHPGHGSTVLWPHPGRGSTADAADARLGFEIGESFAPPICYAPPICFLLSPLVFPINTAKFCEERDKD